MHVCMNTIIHAHKQTRMHVMVRVTVGATVAVNLGLGFEESLTSTLPSMVGRDQEATPKPDGRTQSNTTSILLASTPSMPPSWSMTDPSGTPLFADCQRSIPSMALKSSKSSMVTSFGYG